MKTHVFSVQTLVVAQAGDNVTPQEVIDSIITNFWGCDVKGRVRNGGYQYKSDTKIRIKHLLTK